MGNHGKWIAFCLEYVFISYLKIEKECEIDFGSIVNRGIIIEVPHLKVAVSSFVTVGREN